MRLALLLVPLLAAAPCFAQTSEGALALAGLESNALDPCNHAAPAVDPIGLAAGLEGPIGDAMGLRSSDSIIGIIYAGDPQAGAAMWASTATGGGSGCATLIGILTRPAAETIAELN